MSIIEYNAYLLLTKRLVNHCRLNGVSAWEGKEDGPNPDSEHCFTLRFKTQVKCRTQNGQNTRFN